MTNATEADRKALEDSIKATEKEIKAYEAKEKAMAMALDKLSDIQNKLDTTMSNFIKTQESMAYNLKAITGPLKDLKGINQDLRRAINGTGIVRQEAVYNNLVKLVQSGIVNNAEQRAYLQTLASDLGMIFNAQNGTLTRLIRLQQSDLSSHRMAIESSLKEFLLQNFRTSEYIHEGFENVANSLVEAQSLMTSEAAMSLESSVQKWLGSLGSAGMSTDTITAISKAIGDLGSGNYEMLTGNTGMLINMAAARAGLNIGDLLHNGVSGDTADILMSSLVSYLGEISGGNSNVVKSAYSKIFGFNVSDLTAAGAISTQDDLMAAINGTTISTDISELLGQTHTFVYATTQIQNLLENFMYSWATGIASNPAQYMSYEITKLVSSIAAPLVSAFKGEVGLFGTGLEIDAGRLVQMAPLAAALISGSVNGAGDFLSGFTNPTAIARALFGGGSLSTGNINLFDSLFSNMGVGAAQYIYDMLGGSQMNMFNNKTAALAGNLLFTGESGVSQSGSGYMGDDLGALNSAAVSSDIAGVDGEAGRTLTDIYNRLSDAVNAIIDLPNQPFGTVTRIAEAGNTVSIGQDSALMQDMATHIAMNVQNIYSLLLARFTQSGTANVVDTNSMNWNHPFEWMTKTIGG